MLPFITFTNIYDLIVFGLTNGIFQYQAITFLRNRQFMRGVNSSYRITFILELIADIHLEIVIP